MRRTLFGLLTAAVAIFASATVSAGDRIGIGIKAGTYGVGVDLTGRINDVLGLRASYGRISYSDSFDESGIEFDGDLDAGGAGLMLDIHPFKGQFRLTAGLFKNENAIDLLGLPTESVEIGDTVYTPAQVGTLTGSVDFDDTAPYFGIGYGSAAKAPGRVRFVLDVGVLTQGAPVIGLSSSTGLVDPADIQMEIDEMEEDAKDYKWWPVIAVGVSFRI